MNIIIARVPVLNGAERFCLDYPVSCVLSYLLVLRTEQTRKTANSSLYSNETEVMLGPEIRLETNQEILVHTHCY